MATIFQARPYGRFLDIKCNCKRKKLDGTNQGSTYLGGRFINRDNVRSQLNLVEKVNPNILKNYFSSKTDLSIFTSIAPELLDLSNERVGFFQHRDQKATFCPSLQCLVGQSQVLIKFKMF